MKKPTIDRKKLTSLVALLQKEHPTDATMAFQKLVDDDQFPEIVIWPQWLDIYRKDRSPQEIVKRILNAPKIKIRQFDIQNRMGKGGQRGISKRWPLYADAETILFEPQKIVKRFKLDIEAEKFLWLFERYMRNTPEGFADEYGPMTLKAVDYCIHVLFDVFGDFLRAYNSKERKHRETINLLFGKNFPLSDTTDGKGKKVTYKSIHAAAKAVRGYIYGTGKQRKKQGRSTRFYKDKKFYYLAWLMNIANIYLRFDYSALREKAVEEIQTVLTAYASTYEERIKIAEAVIDKEKFVHEAWTKFDEHRKQQKVTS